MRDDVGYTGAVDAIGLAASFKSLPSKLAHFCPGVDFLSDISIFVERILVVEVDGSMEEKRGSRVKSYEDPELRGKETET